MVFGLPSFQEAIGKLGLGDDTPEETDAVPEGESGQAPPEEAAGTPQEEPAGPTMETAAPEPTKVAGEDVNPLSGTPASADRDMPVQDDEEAKPAGVKGLRESWGGAYKNFMADDGSETSAPSQDEPSPSDSQPATGARDIPVEDLPTGIFNALCDGIGAVVKSISLVGSFVSIEAWHRVKTIRAETVSEFGVLRRFIANLLCGGKEKRVVKSDDI